MTTLHKLSTLSQVALIQIRHDAVDLHQTLRGLLADRAIGEVRFSKDVQARLYEALKAAERLRHNTEEPFFDQLTKEGQ